MFDLLRGKIFAILSETMLVYLNLYVLLQSQTQPAKKQKYDRLAKSNLFLVCVLLFLLIPFFSALQNNEVLKYFLLFLILSEFLLILYLILLIKMAKIYKTIHNTIIMT